MQKTMQATFYEFCSLAYSKMVEERTVELLKTGITRGLALVFFGKQKLIL